MQPPCTRIESSGNPWIDQHPQQVFFRALEDTAPDSWGERMIRRAHARLRQQDRETPALEPARFLMWVDDEARVGALRYPSSLA
jgi:serine/threonine-protein kinase HipA